MVQTGRLEAEVGKARELVVANLAFLGEWTAKAKQLGQDGYGRVQETYGYVTDEKHTLGKAAFITGGTLLGLTLAIRRSLFKKLLYSAVGFGAAASVCHPEKAKETANVGFYIVVNKLNPIIQEQTGLDLKQQYDQAIERIKQLTTFSAGKKE